MTFLAYAVCACSDTLSAKHRDQLDTLGCGSEAGAELEVRIYDLSTYALCAL